MTLLLTGAGPSAGRGLGVYGSYLWLKGDGITGLSDGDAVATWPDSSGNSRHFTQATAGLRPTWQTNEANGRPVVRFDGADDWLTNTTKADWRFLHNGSDWTLFVVFKTTAANPDRTCGILGNNGAASARIGRHLYYDDRSGLGQNNRLHVLMTKGVGVSPILDYATNDDAFPAQTWALISSRFESGVGGDDHVIYVNGVAKASAEPANLPYSALDATHDIQLGANGNAAGLAEGDIAELLLYDSALSNADRIQVEQYLAWRYAL